MTDTYELCREQLRKRVMEALQQQEQLEDASVMKEIESAALKMPQLRFLRPQQKERLTREIYNGIRGLDILEELLGRDEITEIMINGFDNIFIERYGRLERYAGSFSSQSAYENVIQQIVSGCNRVVNGMSPIADARLADGSRVNIVLHPVSLQGTAMTIRSFKKQRFRMQDLIEMGSITEECAGFLEKLVTARYNIFVSGGTGAGKTSFLNALSGYIPEEERIITIEDSAELCLQNVPNLVQLETRNANGQDGEAITIRDLIRTSLRMRPDRIIVGEVRGPECVDMLQAMNTGQSSMSTGHSNSGADMISRLETMYLMGMDIPLRAIQRQLLCIDIIVHLGRLRDGSRKVMEILEVSGLEEQGVCLKPLYQFKERGEQDGKITGYLEQVGKLTHTAKLHMAGIHISA